MLYQPEKDPFAQENEPGPHTLNIEKLDRLISISSQAFSNFAMAREKAKQGLGYAAHTSYASAEHLVKDLVRELGLQYAPPQKVVNFLTDPPREEHLGSARLRAAATGAGLLRSVLWHADAHAERGQVDDAYMLLSDAHDALHEVAKAMGFKLVWAPELVPPVAPTAFASAGAGGTVTGGR